MRNLAIFCLCFVFGLIARNAALAQNYVYAIGDPAFSTQIPIKNGFVDVNNGEIHLELPIATETQRGPLRLDEKLVYDSRIWKIVDNSGSYSWQPTNVPNSMGGWRFESGLPDSSPNYISYYSQYGSCGYEQPQYPTQETFEGFTWRDPGGTIHDFDAALYQQLPIPCDPSPVSNYSSGSALDGSGYYITLKYDPDSQSVDTAVFDKEGNQVYPNPEDRNGNYMSSDGNGNLVDTRGQTPVEESTNGNDIYYDVLTAGGGRARYTVTTETVYYNTGFNQSAVSEAQGSFTAIQSIQLPDGTSYSFAYDSGTSPGHYGELMSMTLPTGGTIDFTYENFLDSFQNENRWLNTVATNSGTTTITPATISNCTSSVGCQEKDTVTDPAGNDTVYTFTLDPGEDANAGSWNTGITAYQGSSTGGVALKSVDTSYTYNTLVAQYEDGPETYIVPATIDVVTTLPRAGLSSQTKTTLDSIGANPTSIQNWDYYSGSAPASPTEQTSYTYGYEVNGASLPTEVAVTDGSGNLISEATYVYDQTTPATTSGLPNHTSPPGYSRGNLTTVSRWINSSGSLYTTAFAYDDAGTMLSSTDPNGTTTYGHDSTDTYVTSITPPTPSSGVTLTSTATYDPGTGLLMSTTGPNGNTTTYKDYDAFGRVGEIDYPDGGKTTFTYSPTQTGEYRYLNSSTYANTETQYDSYGRVSRIAVANGQGTNPWYQQDICYNTSGQVDFRSYTYQGTGFNEGKVCSGAGDTYAYDALGRVTQITQADGTSVSNDYYGRATETTNADGIQRIVQRNAFGQITDVCEITSDSSMPGSGTPSSCGLDIAGTGFLTTYAYNLPDHETTVTQGVQTRTFQSDWLGRPIEDIAPESGTTTYSYAYNSTGLVVTRTRPKANQTNPSVTTTTTTQYDALGRVVSISYSDGTPTRTYSYDASAGWGTISQTNLKGRLSIASVPADGNWAGTAFSYDAMGRVTGEEVCLPSGCGNGADDKNISYTYDWLGDVLTEGDGAGATRTYSYTQAAQVDQILSSVNDAEHPGTLLSNVAYGSFGPVSWHLGNGLNVAQDYNSLGQVDAKSVCSNGSTQIGCGGSGQVYGYSVDWKGSEVLSSTDTVNGDWAYTYNQLGQLATANKNNGQQAFSYVYDRWGNRWEQNVTAGSGPQPQLSFNTSNNQIQMSGYSYDAAGNLTSDGLHTYTYDANGNVIAVDGGNTATYTYDAFNHRIRIDQPGSDSEEFVYNANGQPVSSFDVQKGWEWAGWTWWGNRRVAFYADGMTDFDQADWVGTERMRTEYNASVDGNFESLPFGDGYSVASGEDIDPRHFAMLDRDSGGNDHAMYREYSSMTGRWMSPDPYSGSYNIYNPQSFNRYAYVMNNPLAFTDPSGQQCMPDSSGVWEGCGFELFKMASQGGTHWLSAAIPYIGWGISIGFAIDDLGHLLGWWGGPQFHGTLRPRPSAPSNQMKTCTVNAHGVENNLPTRAPNQTGAYGVPETPGTAAIDRSQWLPPGSNMAGVQANAYINQYRNQISGYVPNGQGGYVEVFNGVSDNMGPGSSVTYLEQRYPGRVLFELPGGQDLGNVNGMQFQIPSAMTCPHQ